MIMRLTCFLFTILLPPFFLSAQVEEYYNNNLGRICEISNSSGVLPHYHTLIGYDSAGLTKQTNSTGQFRIFAANPYMSHLNPSIGSGGFNNYNRFGTLGGNDCIEIRYSSDSSRYWISPTQTNAGILAMNQLPFSVYNVGERSAHNPSISGGHKLLIKVIDQDGNNLYTPGERILVFSEFALPLDSTYDYLSLNPTCPFHYASSAITYFRTGLPAVNYSASTISIPAEGFLPENGTVIRLIASGADSNTVHIYNIPDSIQIYGPGSFSQTFEYYSFDSPVFSLLGAPEGMTLDIPNNRIVWDVTPNFAGMTLNVTLRASNSYGIADKEIKFKVSDGQSGIVEYQTTGSGNKVRLWSRNTGSIGFRQSQQLPGLLYPLNLDYTLLYAGGLYLGGLKSGVGGNPDTVNVTQVEYDSETQPGRILNSGSFGSLTAQDYTNDSTFYVLPEHIASWPADAPRQINGSSLQLSQRDTWTVFNDINLNLSADTVNTKSPGFGIETVRQTFQFGSVSGGDAVFVRLKLINKSDRNYPGFYIGLWNDPDVGLNTSDDLCGVDSSLSFGFTYSDLSGFDDANVAYGCLLLQGPVTTGLSTDTAVITTIGTDGFCVLNRPGFKTIPLTSFTSYRNGVGDPNSLVGRGDLTRYDYLQGLGFDGNPKPLGVFDVGDGVIPADQRMILSSGPFTFAAGDTQEIWYAMIGAQGVDNLNAFMNILGYADFLKDRFHNNINSIVGVEERDNKALHHFVLHQNYPNPFNPSTTISYLLPENGHVSLKIYNVLGQEIRTLVKGTQSAGLQTVQWDGRDKRGQAVSSGVYFYRLETSSFTKTMKMMMMR